MTVILQLVWLGTPIVLSGLLHLLVLTRDLWPALRRAPIDFGATLRGKRVFGANKTWRGALVVIGGSATFSTLFAQFNDATLHWPVPVPYAELHPTAWGALLGLGYILGELPNSFIKRQLEIAPGAMAHGRRGRVFWVADQLDSLAGMLLCVWPVWQPSLAVVVSGAVVLLILHPLSSWIMVLAGLKDRVG
ncbi:MAG TPA: CDP-archaeol synthase [Steroidobacteraceae bacterium]